MSDPAEQPSGEALVRLLAVRDRVAVGLGAELASADPERVMLRLRVTEAHLNFYGYCHGGVIFTLADSAFGLACNAHGEVAVALDVHLTFSTAVRVGETLTATATELTRTRRTGTYRIEVRNDAGALVSHFMGTAHVTGRPTLPLPEQP
ncbi:MAG TPA: hydroxyphenylacetyl-CoA thioesterase PaaI [bacterium]|nr:hydroxyphenylacetyl-CoA thioesterase PaaI [bacterium]